MNPSPDAVRVAIVGAGSLRGKEVKVVLEELDFPSSEIRLLDEELVAGTLTEAAGEPAVIETVDEDSFERVRFAFFTGSPAFSARQGSEARRAGATVIDLSGGMVAESGARLWIPALDAMLPSPDGNATPGERRSLFLAPSVPADVVISLSAAFAPMGLNRLVLTFFQPVSERGWEGVEEMEKQVVKLLSFEPIPKKVFDAQVGFNMLPTYGDESSEKLADVRARIVRDVRAYLAGHLPMPAISLVQAPVFYSHAFTAYAEFKSAPVVKDLVAQLEKAGLKVAAADEPAPTNVSVVGESRPVVGQPEPDPGIENGVWIWGAADNLRVPAATAVAIAEKLLAS
jgi:aspartate-semialdehyde dehydrogenase